ncbi:MAG: helix-turn-helix domain-containing protein [Propionibacteriaceae bacterium]|nr:helix-turn-helix domain-containing protein [Propionibacteriaceae bacterium]
MNPGAAVADIGGVAYGLFPVAAAGEAGEERAQRTAAQFLDRVGTGFKAVAAVGPAAADATALAAARQGVDRILRVLRGAGQPGRVARLADVQTEALLVDLGDLAAARGDPPVGPIARLIDYDESADTHLVTTLRTWLATFGDAQAAAAQLFIHPNTLRYRLRRIAEVSGLDLTNPDERFAAELQLRILP